MTDKIISPYKLLVTGVGICGKTTLARKLERDLAAQNYNVQNVDLDYNTNWRQVNPDSQFYILQTPHGCESEIIDGIDFNDFKRILYIQTDRDTYHELLAVRGMAWFRKGVVEATEDFDPKPYSLEKLKGILRKTAGYASRMESNLQKDLEFFSRYPSTRILDCTIQDEDTLAFNGYKETLEDILEDLKK